MDLNDCFIFCQKDMVSLSFLAFGDMREKNQLIDFKVVLDNRSFVGHRLVLSAAIPYFRNLFTCTEEEEITLGEMDLDALESLIDFAYSGQIRITHKNVRPLISASKFVCLNQVQDACWEFLEKRLDADNVWEIRELAKRNLHSKLVSVSGCYMSQNFEAFSKSEGFLSLPFPYLMELINREDMRVTIAEDVFEAVIRWVKASPTERGGLIPVLLKCWSVRNPNPDYLKRIVSQERVRMSDQYRDLLGYMDSFLNSVKVCDTSADRGNFIFPTKSPRPVSSFASHHGKFCARSQSELKIFDPERDQRKSGSPKIDDFTGDLHLADESVYPAKGKKGQKKRYVKAMYSHIPADDDELMFYVNDVIEVIDDASKHGWHKGNLKGKIGLYPSNYFVEHKIEDADDTSFEGKGRNRNRTRRSKSKKSQTNSSETRRSKSSDSSGIQFGGRNRSCEGVLHSKTSLKKSEIPRNVTDATEITSNCSARDDWDPVSEDYWGPLSRDNWAPVANDNLTPVAQDDWRSPAKGKSAPVANDNWAPAVEDHWAPAVEDDWGPVEYPILSTAEKWVTESAARYHDGKVEGSVPKRTTRRKRRRRKCDNSSSVEHGTLC